MQQSKKHTAQLETEAAEHVQRERVLTAEIDQLNTRLAVVEKEHQLSIRDLETNIRESQERTQQLQQEKAELEKALMVLKEQTSLTESQRT